MTQQTSGKLHKKFDIQVISENFQKREFVIKTDEQYPQLIQMELQHDNVYALDNIDLNTEIKVSFNLRGKSWINPDGIEKFFNTVVAWKIEAQSAPAYVPAQTPPENTTAFPNQNDDDEPDDLPF